jgi:cytochrome c-type biogenesis protein CcmI
LLSLYVADTGVRAESDRLHRRRPVKTPDRTYLALEAFEVEPGETVRLALAPLGAPSPLPRAALLGLVVLAAGLVFAFVAAPLRPDRADAVEAGPEDAASERVAVYAALRDLEHDRETGKLADEDYASMRAELRARAAALLRDEDSAPPTPQPEPVATVSSAPCVVCAAPLRATDRFCPSCGARAGAIEATGA